MQTARQIVANQQAAQAAFFARYRNISGATDYGCPEVETVEEVAARLHQHAADARAFRRTALGRFLTAVDQLEAAGGYEDEALRLRGYYSRSLADQRDPLNVSAVSACIRILAGINVSVARDGIAALADVMAERVAA